MALGATAYVGYVTWAQREAVSQALTSISAAWLASAIAAFMAMTASKAAYHQLLVAHLHASAARHPKAVMSSFLVGQLLRYLPGKIWGLAYQAGRLREVCPPSTVVIANGVQMAMSILVTSLLVATLLAFQLGVDLAWMLPPALMAIVIAAHRHTHVLGRAMSRLSRNPMPTERAHGEAPLRFAMFGTVLLAIDWMFFVAGFMALGNGMVRLVDALPLAVTYAGASVMAMAAVAVPAGFGVREALFVSTADLSGFSAGSLVVWGVVARIAMTVADAIAGLAAIGLMRPEQDDG